MVLVFDVETLAQKEGQIIPFRESSQLGGVA
jgi:hypothetical protein